MTSTPTLSFLSVPESVFARLLSLVEREKIADLHREGLSLRAIGREVETSGAHAKRSAGKLQPSAC